VWDLAGVFARRGLAVLAQCTPAAAGLLGVAPPPPGPDPAHDPLVVTLHEQLLRAPGRFAMSALSSAGPSCAG